VSRALLAVFDAEETRLCLNVSRRFRAAYAGIVGPLVGSVLLRVRPNEAAEDLMRVRDQVLEAINHSVVPIEAVLGHADPNAQKHFPVFVAADDEELPTTGSRFTATLRRTPCSPCEAPAPTAFSLLVRMARYEQGLVTELTVTGVLAADEKWTEKLEDALQDALDALTTTY
jgi:hypothetical protein